MSQMLSRRGTCSDSNSNSSFCRVRALPCLGAIPGFPRTWSEGLGPVGRTRWLFSAWIWSDHCFLMISNAMTRPFLSRMRSLCAIWASRQRHCPTLIHPVRQLHRISSLCSQLISNFFERSKLQWPPGRFPPSTTRPWSKDGADGKDRRDTGAVSGATAQPGQAQVSSWTHVTNGA